MNNKKGDFFLWAVAVAFLILGLGAFGFGLLAVPVFAIKALIAGHALQVFLLFCASPLLMMFGALSLMTAGSLSIDLGASRAK